MKNSMKRNPLRRDTEQTMTKFVGKTSELRSFFDTKDSIFPLIPCQFETPSYCKASLTLLQYSEMESAFSSLFSNPDCQMFYRNNYEVAENNDGREEYEAESIDNPYLQPPRLACMKIWKRDDNNWYNLAIAVLV
jgi:hypothetical protein